MPECDEKLFILEQEFALYRGRLFVQGEDDVENDLRKRSDAMRKLLSEAPVLKEFDRKVY